MAHPEQLYTRRLDIVVRVDRVIISPRIQIGLLSEGVTSQDRLVLLADDLQSLSVEEAISAAKDFGVSFCMKQSSDRSDIEAIAELCKERGAEYLAYFPIQIIPENGRWVDDCMRLLSQKEIVQFATQRFDQDITHLANYTDYAEHSNVDDAKIHDPAPFFWAARLSYLQSLLTNGITDGQTPSYSQRPLGTEYPRVWEHSSSRMYWLNI